MTAIGCKLNGGLPQISIARKFVAETDVCNLGVCVQRYRLDFVLVRQFDDPATRCEKGDAAKCE